MDDSEFDDLNRLSDLENNKYAGIFLFHKCSSNKLERVSIRNAKVNLNGFPTMQAVPVPQNALIKFIRNAPSTLKSFRSDLSPENMTMLRSERPEIELLN